MKHFFIVSNTHRTFQLRNKFPNLNTQPSDKVAVWGCLNILVCSVFILIVERPSLDEEDLYIILQKCLALRESYVFREEVAPWEKEVITEPSTPKPNLNPFAYVLEQKTDVSFLCRSKYASHFF